MRLAMLALLITLMATSLAFADGSGHVAEPAETPAGAVITAGAPETPEAPPAAAPAATCPSPAAAPLEPYATRTDLERHVMAGPEVGPRGPQGLRGPRGYRGLPGSSGRNVTNNFTMISVTPPAKPAPDSPTTPTPTATYRGEGRFQMPWWAQLLIVTAGLATIIGVTIGLVSMFVRNGQIFAANAAASRIGTQRAATGEANPPAPAGPSQGAQTQTHYDHMGRIVFTRRDEWPVRTQVQQVGQGVNAVMAVDVNGGVHLLPVPQPPAQPAQPGPHNQPVPPAGFPPVAQPGQPAIQQPPADPNAQAAAGAA